MGGANRMHNNSYLQNYFLFALLTYLSLSRFVLFTVRPAQCIGYVIEIEPTLKKGMLKALLSTLQNDSQIKAKGASSCLY